MVIAGKKPLSTRRHAFRSSFAISEERMPSGWAVPWTHYIKRNTMASWVSIPLMCRSVTVLCQAHNRVPRSNARSVTGFFSFLSPDIWTENSPNELLNRAYSDVLTKHVESFSFFGSLQEGSHYLHAAMRFAVHPPCLILTRTPNINRKLSEWIPLTGADGRFSDYFSCLNLFLRLLLIICYQIQPKGSNFSVFMPLFTRKRSMFDAVMKLQSRRVKRQK